MIRLLIVSLFITYSFTAQSQNKRDKVREKIEAKKIGFLTDNLELSPDEAKVFWPVYNEYRKAMKEAMPKRKGERVELDDVAALAKLDEMIVNGRKVLDVKKAYIDKFINVIGAKKTVSLFHYDRKFKEDMIRNLKDNWKEKE